MDFYGKNIPLTRDIQKVKDNSSFKRSSSFLTIYLMGNNLFKFKQLILVVILLLTQIVCWSKTGPYKSIGTIVKGKVIDATSQEALIGVAITLKGTKTGTVTDTDGNFSINVAGENSVLAFSFVGYETQQITVGKQTFITVKLQNNTTELNGVIVVGYGTQKKSDITGSVVSLKMKEIEKAPSFRVDQSLQGRVAGVNIQNTDASPNAQVSVRIRGASSINGGNNPLVVIDGMQGGSLTTLNPNDVASIEVLKDASATAIYGSRGSSGVILVTTKQGVKGKNDAPEISYNTYFSVTQVRKKLDQLNAAEYAESVNANRREYGQNPVFSDADIAGFKAKGGTDWQDAIFRNGFTQNHQLSISNATEKTSYYVSGNATTQKGLVQGSSYNRYAIRTNLKTNLSEKLSLGINGFLVREMDHPTVLNTFAGNNAGSPVFSALVWSPTKSIYDSQGNYTLPGGGAGPNTNYNPLALATEPVRDYLTTTTNFTGNINYQILKGLNLTVLGSYRSSEFEGNDYFNSLPTRASGTEMASIVNQRNLFLQNTNMLTYETAIKGGHNLKLTGVVEQQFEENNGSYAGAIGFSTDALTYNNLSLGQKPQISSSYRNSRTLMSYLGRVNYGYKDRYLLTLSLRSDGSSVFGANNKWGSFPSAAIGWNILNESFMTNLKNVFYDLKLRGSYGIVGNQAISPYQSLASLNTYNPYPINGTNLSTGVGVGGNANPDLRWEKTTQSDIGLDATFLNGRLELSADYYNKQTSDLLLSVPTPMTAGGNGTILKNVGSVENKGFELYIGGTPIKQDITWHTGFTLASNSNKVLALAEGQTEILLGNPGLPGFGQSLWLEVGQPLGLFRGYQYNGVWKSGEAEQAKKYGAVPGDSKYIDQNGDGVIDNKDIVDIGNAQPKYTFGWNNSFSYKNLDLNILLQGVQGNKIYNLSRVRFEAPGSDGDATSRKVLDRWTPQHENTDVPSFKGSNDGRLNSSRWLEDGSYLRVKNISLGYTLPKNVINRLKMSQLRVYLSATNLFTFTKYTGFDPESSSGVDTRAGVDLATYPAQKTFTLGLDIKF
ncbi:TonB-linked outer membrane protein, SusC/RagA family [Pseudarcicella hirudinis]|uniref:TonB-linked outer membrane protein, SusC/RagA family n=2 Tax=Pseudarcicella hirudinis TaxID=1079859 RepID=A0A1I5VJQ4_9BACT|nr:TonB-linked outer membrane protein, SusC/RagA family [Pseudarcicella hirudinis]